MNKNMLRFAIPFHIANYEVLKKDNFLQVEKAGWTRAHIIQGENDLYDYITELIGDKTTSAIAQSWKLPREIFHKERFMSEVSDKSVSWKLADLGFLAFNDGLGIYWYEVDASSLVDTNEFLDLAYSLKELSRGNNEKNYAMINVAFSGLEDSKYVALEADSSVEILEIKETKQGSIAVCKKQVSLFRDVLCKYIPFLEIDSFFSNRKKESGKILYPDRAIAFSWIYDVVTEKDNNNAHDIAFHLGRTYKATYEMTTNYKDEDFYVPFDDSIWYGSLEGCGNYTGPTKEKEFYKSGYEGRLNTYYYIFLLCLGQYYSLLQLAHRVSVLPTDEAMYSSKNSILEKMIDQIHIFNLKNNYSQVGHLTQHNEFYAYLQDRLGINKMQEELEVELQALFEMIERKKTIKQEKNYRVLSIIGGIFVVLQAFINVAAMYNSAMDQDWGYFCFGIIGSAALAVLGVIIWLLSRIGHKER